MRPWRLRALALTSLVLAGVAGARAETPEPYQLVRALELLQDDVVNGNADARAGQRTMLEQMGAQFLKVDSSVWQSNRNAQAAVMFVLNGGSPTVVRKVIDIKSLPEADRDLMVGALAYVSGREQQAIDRFSRIDPMKLSEGLGGNVALAMGSLLIRHDPVKAIRLFSIARLLLPGTLIEEAALRRQAFIYFDQNDLEAFSRISAQYLRRYGNSAYSGQFRERLDLTIRHLAHGDDPSVITKLGALIGQKGDPFSAELLLLFAREALLHGRIPIARAAIAKADDMKNLADVETARLQLYSAFADIFSADPDAAGKALVAAAPKVSSPEDRWLVEAGARLLGQIVLWPPAVPTNPAEAGRETEGVQGEAAKALLASSELLARADR